MKLWRYVAIASTVVMSLLDLPAAVSDTDMPRAVEVVGTIVGAVGLVVAVAMLRRRPWAPAAVIALGVLNIAGGVAAVAAEWEGGPIGIVLGFAMTASAAPVVSLRALRAAAGITAAAAAMAVFAGPTDHASAAGTEAFTSHTSVDIAGAVFQCGQTAITVTGGTIWQTAHFSPDAHGDLHFSIALVPRSVTAADAAGNGYTITGASHVAGRFTGDQLDLVTDASHFVITDGTGVVGRVSLVDHYNVRGHSFTLATGDCTAPAH
jgi:hypothetical protein